GGAERHRPRGWAVTPHSLYVQPVRRARGGWFDHHYRCTGRQRRRDSFTARRRAELSVDMRDRTWIGWTVTGLIGRAHAAVSSAGYPSDSRRATGVHTP